MLEAILQADEQLFLWLNNSHTAWGDILMWHASKMWSWTPVYVWMLLALFKGKSPVNAVVALICIAVLLFLTDFVAVKTVKETVMRLRPTHNPQLEGLVQMVRDDLGNFYRGGRYGFFSNHASNFSGVAVFFSLVMRPLSRVIRYSLVTWVLLIGFSRIYLGVHYPLDVCVGFLYGALAGYLLFFVFRKFEKKENNP